MHAAERSERGLLGRVLDLLFPARCVGCGVRGEHLCATCRPAVPWLGPDVCPRCATPSRLGRICRRCRGDPGPLDGVRAACRYEGLARQAIHDLKYRRARVRAPLLAGLAAEALEQRPVALDLLMPVPLWPGRQRERGFNQSELIARDVARRLGVDVDVSSLARTRDTGHQVGRAAHERLTNVAGAFACPKPDRLQARRVGLVDDVMTTGATLRACAAALKAAGASRVVGLVVAREV